MEYYIGRIKTYDDDYHRINTVALIERNNVYYYSARTGSITLAYLNDLDGSAIMLHKRDMARYTDENNAWKEFETLIKREKLYIIDIGKKEKIRKTRYKQLRKKYKSIPPILKTTDKSCGSGFDEFLFYSIIVMFCIAFPIIIPCFIIGKMAGESIGETMNDIHAIRANMDRGN